MVVLTNGGVYNSDRTLSQLYRTLKAIEARKEESNYKKEVRKNFAIFNFYRSFFSSEELVPLLSFITAMRINFKYMTVDDLKKYRAMLERRLALAAKIPKGSNNFFIVLPSSPYENFLHSSNIDYKS